MAGQSRLSTFDGRTLLRVLAIIGLGTVAVIVCAWAMFDFGDDGDTTVPAPLPADGTAAAAQLQQATAAHGVCYGWRLENGIREISVGSNFGNNVPVGSDAAACPRRVELVVTIRYEPESSEAEDSAVISVESAGDVGSPRPSSADLARLGLTQGRFLDDPADSVIRGALALPLLVAERGAVGPVPAPPATGGPAASAPPAASSDFWRDRRGLMFWAIGIVLLAGFVALYGWLVVRAERRKDTKPLPWAKKKASATKAATGARAAPAKKAARATTASPAQRPPADGQPAKDPASTEDTGADPA